MFLFGFCANTSLSLALTWKARAVQLLSSVPCGLACECVGAPPIEDLEHASELTAPELGFLQQLAGGTPIKKRRRDSPVQAAAQEPAGAAHVTFKSPEQLLQCPPPSVTEVLMVMRGPRAAGKLLQASWHSGEERTEWLEKARTQAIAGSCPKSHASVLSGMRFYSWFAMNMLQLRGDLLPPSIDSLLQYSRLFKHDRTFSNYLSALKLACELQGKSVDVFQHPSIRRAKQSIKKRKLNPPKEHTWIDLQLLELLLSLVITRPELRDMMMLFIASYAFLLRLPSEGLPMAARSCPAGAETPVFSITDEGEAKLWFPCRKHKLYPTYLLRKCWCKASPTTCPVHILGSYMQSHSAGHQPFAHIRADQARLALRMMLAEIGVPNAEHYGTKVFRRGHTEDMVEHGSRIGEIAEAGTWSSRAFSDYLSKFRLERDRVAEAKCCPAEDSSSESDDMDFLQCGEQSHLSR